MQDVAKIIIYTQGLFMSVAINSHNHVVMRIQNYFIVLIFYDDLANIFKNLHPNLKIAHVIFCHFLSNQ